MGVEILGETLYQLENKVLKVEISSHGAEVKSIYNKKLNIEYLWQGSKDSWARTFPILFPIVGKLKNNTYTYQNKQYNMSQHGFARDNEFSLLDRTDEKISFVLSDSDTTRKIYPFKFQLTVTYFLKENVLDVEYKVENTALDEKLYYSIGGHPGFNIPFLENTSFDEYSIKFKPSNKRKRYFLDEDSHLLPDTVYLNKDKNHFDLSHELFKNEAIILEVIEDEESFTIKHNRLKPIIEIKMYNTPVMDFWSTYPKYGEFISVEPCWGLADPVNQYGEINNKPFINQLLPKEEEIHKYSFIFNY